MIEWLYSLDFYHWILFGLVLLVAEVFVGGSFMMWMGFSAILVGLLLLLLPLAGIHMDWEWQLIIFGGGALVALYLWRRYVTEEPQTEAPGLNQRGSDLVGRVVPLKDAIHHGTGIVVIHDTHWKVSGPDLPAGTMVKLLALNDQVFTVTPVDD